MILEGLQKLLGSSTFAVLALVFITHALSGGTIPLPELLVASGIFGGKEGLRYIGEGLAAKKA